MGRSLSGLGLFACFVAVAGAGCGGGTNFGGDDNGGTGTDIGANPAPVSSIPRLLTEGTRGEISIVGSPNVTPSGADDFKLLKVTPTDSIALTFPNTYTILAPQIWADRKFKEWQLNGTVIETDWYLQLSHIPSSLDGTLKAVYEPYVLPAGRDFEPNYNADLDSSYRWPELPLKIWFDPLLAPNEGARQLLRNGLDKWVRASGGVIDYVEVKTAGEADIKFRSAENLLNVGPGVLGVALTVQVADSLNNDLDYSTVWLIRAQFGAQNTIDRLNYESTVAHEFGHALGLYGHSNYENDIMYAFSGPLDITENDINSLANLYKAEFDGGNTVPTP